MSTDKPEWEDQEETIVSFPPIAESAPMPPPATAPVTEAESMDEDESTIPWPGPVDSAKPADEDRTIVAHGAAQPGSVERLAWLVIVKTASVRVGQIFPLNKPRCDIGRASGVAIFVNDKKAGHSHATVKYEIAEAGSQPEFVLYDLASANGTFVNGQKLAGPRILKDGDRILIGDTELVFKSV